MFDIPKCLLHLFDNDLFDGRDYAFLSSIAKQYQQKGFMPEAQINAVARLLPKYAGHLQHIPKPKQPKQKPAKVFPLSITIGKQCILRGVTPKQIKALKAELTIDNPKYTEAVRFGRWIDGSTKPKLKFFQQGKNSFRFVRGYFNQALEILGNPKIIDKRKVLSEIDFSFTGKLRPYQNEAIKDILKHDEGVLESGTGSGKTVMALAIISRRKQPTLILVHSKELLYQWAERIDSFLGIKAGLVGDGHFKIKPVTIAIINSAKNNIEKLAGHFGQVCVDECHRVPSTMFTEVVTAFDCKYILGLSATAFRRDGLTKLIHFYIGEVRYKIEMEDLQAVGAVLKPKYIMRDTDFEFDFEDSYSKMISALTKDVARNKLICSDIFNELQRDSGIILVVSDRVTHCKVFSDYLVGIGVDCALLTGGTGSNDREMVVKNVQAGSVRVLISTIQLIGEGFDCNGLSVLFLTTPIASKGRLKQVVGRVLRPADGKEAIVYDYCDSVGVLERSAFKRMQIFK